MLASTPIMAFLATSHAAEATAFYRDKLGLKLVSEEQWAIVFEANGTMLRIQRAKDWKPPQHTAFGWRVTDIEATVAQLADRGVAIEKFEFAGPTGIWTTPDGTRVAWFKDPDGNILSLTQFA
jgi:predicted enzyme related to lactoylglutathione lyase